jgi:hypothetical protein
MTTPIRWITRPYIEAGLHQNWNMFSNPLTADHYMRVGYEVAASDGRRRPWMVQELVFPADREDRVRLFHQFRDKAIQHVLEKFSVATARDPRAMEDTPRPTGRTPVPLGSPELAREFEPLVRYFRNRYRDTYLEKGERIIRTEVWAGAAAIPPRGGSLPQDVIDRRDEALNRYYSGPAYAGSVAEPPPLGRKVTEADILWELIFVDES